MSLKDMLGYPDEHHMKSFRYFSKIFENLMISLVDKGILTEEEVVAMLEPALEELKKD